VPIHEYRCDAGHKFERLFLTFAAAEAESETTLCDICATEIAERLISAPGVPICVGEGFHKPAVGGPITGKADVTKLLRDVNQSTNNQLHKRIQRAE
jgi:hypothetical protein